MWARLSAAALAASLAAAQPVPLPPSPDFWLRVGSETAQVKLDVFVDLLCPDCAAEWTTLLAVAAHYSPSQLALRVHLFPLPYHTWAFSAAYAANAIAAVNASDAAKLAWTSYMFNGARRPAPRRAAPRSALSPSLPSSLTHQ